MSMTDNEKQKNNDDPELVEIEDADGFKTRDAAEALKKAKTDLKECRAKAEEYLAGWQRAKADFINGRRDAEKEREATAKFANERMTREVLDVVDGLEMALASMKNDPRAEGLNSIYRRLLQILRGYGVSPIEAKGVKFNPAEHESVVEEGVSDEVQDQVVLEELQKGYTMHDKVIRPARVKIGYYKK